MTDNEAFTAICKELASLTGRELSPEEALAAFARLGEYEKYLAALKKLEGVKLEISKRDLKRTIGDRIGRATSSQSGTDRALTEARKRIAELEATVAKLTEERDAARLAYLDLLDQSIKGGAK